MNKIKYAFLIVLLPLLNGKLDAQVKASVQLDSIINSYQDHEGYDRKAYPLGLFTKEYYKAEAEFAQAKLNELNKVKVEELNETQQISVELLKFELQDQIDYYTFEQYLNPLLSDSGFHSSLTYIVRPLNNYRQVKWYLNQLNAIPDFVDQNFKNLREGLEKGVSQPLVIFK